VPRAARRAVVVVREVATVDSYVVVMGSANAQMEVLEICFLRYFAASCGLRGMVSVG
jgi:hypothetical protein